jgi:hypothetical protein
MPTKTIAPRTSDGRVRPTQAATSPTLQQSRTPASRLESRLPAKSIARAASAFKHFSLSKFPQKGVPSNYVPAGKNSVDIQRKAIRQRLQELSKVPASNRGMTLALSDATIAKHLRSHNSKAATIDLGELISLLTKNMKGTQFYANGNPTFNRLSLQSRLKRVMADIKEGPRK